MAKFTPMSNADKQAYQEWQDLRKRIAQHTSSIKVETEGQKRARIVKLLSPGNFEEFCKFYFPHYIDSDFGWFHKEAARNILENNEGLDILEWAREHAKSIFADVFIPLYMKAKGELTGMILGSENEDKAKGLIKDIEAELRDNKQYLSDFGEQYIVGSWLQANFTTVNDGVGFWAFGLGQNPAGVRNAEKRPNLGVVDDADSRKLAKNQQRTKEAVDWILGDFLGCLSIKGKKFIYANNRVAKNGITAHMVGDVEENDPKRVGIRHIKVYALENHKHEMALPGTPGAKPAWKERYTYEQICKRIDEMGYRNSMRQFFHRHIEDGNIFKPEDIVFATPLALDKYEALITYVDPSFKDTKKNDFKAIVLVGKSGKYYDVIWCWIRQGTKSNMVKAHYDIHEFIEDGYIPKVHNEGTYALKQVICQHYMEANFIQDIMLEEYNIEGEARGYQLRVRPDKRAKPDKFGRIEDLQPLFARGLIRFNEVFRSSADMQTLKDQFLAFPNGHDDGPDAVEGAIYLLSKKTKVTPLNVRMGKYKNSTSRRG